MRSLDVQLNMARSNLTYGNVEGGRPVEFTLEALDVLLPPGRPLTARLRGTLLGERFAAELRGGDLPTMRERSARPAQAHRHRTRLDADGRRHGRAARASRAERTSRFACPAGARETSAAGWACHRQRTRRS